MFSNTSLGITSNKDRIPFGLNNRKECKPVPLLELDMKCTVQDQFITLQICQIYQNFSEKPIEVEYVFPVSNDASVASLKIQTESGLIINAVIEEKEQAKEQYEDIIAQGNTAFMASYDQDDSQDRMVLYIGNLQPLQKVTVMITYVGLCVIEEQNQVLFIPCAFTPKYDLQVSQTNKKFKRKEEQRSRGMFKKLFSCCLKNRTSKQQNQEEPPNQEIKLEVSKATQVEMTNQVPYRINISCDIKYQEKEIIQVDCTSHNIITQQESSFH